MRAKLARNPAFCHHNTQELCLVPEVCVELVEALIVDCNFGGRAEGHMCPKVVDCTTRHYHCVRCYTCSFYRVSHDRFLFRLGIPTVHEHEKCYL